MRINATWASLLVVGVSIASCATGGDKALGQSTSATVTSAETGMLADVGPPSPDYDSAAVSDEAGRSAAEVALAARVAAALAARGDVATSDGKLGTIADVFVRRADQSQAATATDVDNVARHVGFVGTIVAAKIFATTSPGPTEPWQDELTHLESNLRITRFAVRVRASEGIAAVVFGDVSLSLKRFAKRYDVGSAVRLRGELSPTFSSGSAYLADAKGNVREIALRDRRFEVSFDLGTPGRHRVEIMGNGPLGPLILANVPIYVGVNEPALRWLPVPTTKMSTDVASVEAELFSLLNLERTRAGLPTLLPHPGLRAMAAAHSADMKRTHVFAHISPVTGTPGDRLARAHIETVLAGENLSQAATVAEVHNGLMESPGHRANMLAPRFTHVGIGVEFLNGPDANFLATYEFGRWAMDAHPATVNDVAARAKAFRQQRRLPMVPLDPILVRAAEAGIQAYARAVTDSPGAMSAASAASATAVNQSLARSPLPPGSPSRKLCVGFADLLDVSQLDDLPELADVNLRSVGFAVWTHKDQGVTKLATLLLTDGDACKTTK